MANTKSAKKAARQTVRRTAVNKARRTRLRSSVRKVEEAIASGNKEAAAAALKEAEPIIARNAQKGVVHRKTASRKVSRLAKRVRALGIELKVWHLVVHLDALDQLLLQHFGAVAR